MSSEKILSQMERICVAVRVRPALERERSNRFFYHATQTSPDDRDILLREVIPMDVTQGAEPMILANHTFSFDSVFDCLATQGDVYNQCARPAAISVLEGYNSCILAYGQTGTGKTYTMEGESGESRGIVARCLQDIFSYISSTPDQSQWSVSLSYLQIYNDTLSDLLATGKPLSLRQDIKRGGVNIENLSSWQVACATDALELFANGNLNRSTAQTKHNDLSSRSHAVLTVTVRHVCPDGAIRTGKLNLVDLAGSERVRVTGASGLRLQEGKCINQSLSALGNVVAALVEGKSHVPFRDSKLTRILEDSLGGNCRFTLVVTISPASDAFSESLSTLKFAQRASGLRTRARINSEVFDNVEEVQKELKKERAMRERLEERLKRMGGDRTEGELEILLNKQKEALQTMTQRFSHENTVVSEATIAVIGRLDKMAANDPVLQRELLALKKSLKMEISSTRLAVMPPLTLESANQSHAEYTVPLTPSAILGKMRSLSTARAPEDSSPSQSVDQLIAKRKLELEQLRRQSSN